ncbi:MAG TPA: CBS domain-containing protein [Hyphomicrobiaceae bacterium]|jgi:CBS domain-containing protein|nr:CBS domain-containing protein [Hyphomicrobiaceae bacterium]
MQARDLMVSPVVTVQPSASVKEVAKLLLEQGISAVPVVDDQGKLVGVVSEGDLLHRSEIGSERRRSWWLLGLTDEETLAAEYVKAHARKVADVMTRKVITAAPDASLRELATLMEANAIKRVPIIEGDRLVGIVSRANLVRAFASVQPASEIELSDANIRGQFLAHLQNQAWARPWLLNIMVSNGVVDLWGVARSDAERRAVRIAAESIDGVRAVNDNLVIRP